MQVKGYVLRFKITRCSKCHKRSKHIPSVQDPKMWACTVCK